LFAVKANGLASECCRPNGTAAKGMLSADLSFIRAVRVGPTAVRPISRLIGQIHHCHASCKKARIAPALDSLAALNISEAYVTSPARMRASGAKTPAAGKESPPGA